MTIEDVIKCRAQLGCGCHHDDEDFSEYEGMPAWRDDRTYDESSDTVVCDWCFLQLPNNGRFNTLEELALLMAKALMVDE